MGFPAALYGGCSLLVCLLSDSPSSSPLGAGFSPLLLLPTPIARIITAAILLRVD